MVNAEGAEVVVLEPAAYERLDATRRQVGAQASRIRALRQSLLEATAFLDELEQTLLELPACDLEPAGDCLEDGGCERSEAGCVRERLLGLLGARPEPLRRRAELD